MALVTQPAGAFSARSPSWRRPRKRRWGKGGTGAIAPVQNLHSTITPRENPSPAVLCMKSMVNTTGLDAGAEVVALCSIWSPDHAAIAPTHLLPSAVYRADRQPKLRARSARGPRVEGVLARGPRVATRLSARRLGRDVAAGTLARPAADDVSHRQDPDELCALDDDEVAESAAHHRRRRLLERPVG